MVNGSITRNIVKQRLANYCLQAKKDFMLLNGWKEFKWKIIFHNTCKLYETQMSMATNKVLWKQNHIYSFIFCLWHVVLQQQSWAAKTGWLSLQYWLWLLTGKVGWTWCRALCWLGFPQRQALRQGFKYKFYFYILGWSCVIRLESVSKEKLGSQ